VCEEFFFLLWILFSTPKGKTHPTPIIIKTPLLKNPPSTPPPTTQKNKSYISGDWLKGL
jgi:hypothetical protein